MLEARFRLADAEHLDGTTWRYDLINPDTDRIRAIVTDPSVADTHDLDRSAYTLSASAARTGGRGQFSNAGDCPRPRGRQTRHGDRRTGGDRACAAGAERDSRLVAALGRTVSLSYECQILLRRPPRRRFSAER